MKRLAIAASVGAILIGAYSFVYACKESRPSASTARASHTATWYAAHPSHVPVDQVAGEPLKVVCKTVEAAAPVAIQVDVSREALRATGTIHAFGAAVKHAPHDASTVQNAKRVVATLGRAFVTTVGAVFGSLVDQAIEFTAGLV